MQTIKFVVKYPSHVDFDRELYTRLNVTSDFSYQLIRDPRVERERMLAELEKISEPREMTSLRRAIEALERRGKRMTLGRLMTATGGESNGFEERSFRGITKAARVYKILTNTTDRRGRGYGLFEWDV